MLTKTEKPPPPTTEKGKQQFKRLYLNNAAERGKGRFAKRFSGERLFRSAFKFFYFAFFQFKRELVRAAQPRGQAHAYLPFT